MAVTFLEPGSAATQDMSLFDTTGTSGTGAVTSDAQALFGSVRSVKCSEVSGNNDLAYVDKACAGDTGRCSFSFRMSKDMDVSAADIWVMNVDALNWSFALATDFPNHLRVYSGSSGTNMTTTNIAIQGNTDYRITIAWNIVAANDYTIKIWINGTLDVTITFATASVNIRTGCTTIAWGWRHRVGPSTTNYDLFFGDIYVDDSGNLTDPWNGIVPVSGKPQLGVTAKIPIANGTTNDFTTQIGAGGSGTGTGHSPQVNERPRSDTNGWSLNTALVKTEEYSIQSKSAGDVDISGNLAVMDFMGWVRAKTAGGTRTCSIIVGGVSTNISVTTSSATYTKIAGSTTYPAGNTDIGIASPAVSDTYSLYECGIIVAYQPTNAVYEQEGFRFRDDNGSEITASWLASQDTNISRAKLTNTRLRMLSNVTYNPPSQALKLQYRKANGADEWKDVD